MYMYVHIMHVGWAPIHVGSYRYPQSCNLIGALHVSLGVLAMLCCTDYVHVHTYIYILRAYMYSYMYEYMLDPMLT